MNELNGTGVEHPTVTLGGKQYTVKFTRGSLAYRMSKLGVSFADLAPGPRNFSALVDIFYAALTPQFEGTPEEFAGVVLAEQKVLELDAIVGAAIKKVFPPTQPKNPDTAGKTTGEQVQ
jgi:hypothetical protein